MGSSVVKGGASSSQAAGVAILMSEPQVCVAGMVKVHKCQNYEQLAAEMDRVYAEFCKRPSNPNPSIADPMPGFCVSYLQSQDDLPDLNPTDMPWNLFAAALDLIIAVPK